MSKVAPSLEFTPDDFYKCSVLNMRSLIFIICLFFILSCISTLINSFFVDRDTLDDLILEQIMKRRHPRRITQFNPRFMRDNLMGQGILVEEYPGMPKISSLEKFSNEQFSNDTFYSYADISKPNYPYYQFTKLTAPTDIFGNPDNYQIGEAFRLLKQANDGKMGLFLDVSASLYLLNANPFGKDNVANNKIIDQDYLVYLINTKTNAKKLLSKLIRDGDDLYKYKYQTTDKKEIEDLLSFDKIIVVYKKDSKEKNILQGNFLS